MRVTVCQLECQPETIGDQLTALAQHAAESGSEFLLLPEMPFSPWLAADSDPDPVRWGAAVADHDARIARLHELGIGHIAGTRPIVTELGSRRNQAFLFEQATRTTSGAHEKYYLPDEDGYWEHRWYDRGAREFDTARAGDARIGFQICTEMWFLEWSRHYSRSRIDLLCVPRATPRGSTEKWIAGGRAAAVCAGAYCLSSNHWNEAGSGPDCGGVGWVVDPEGEVLALTSDDRPFATVDVDLAYSRQSKSTYPRDVLE